MTNRKGNYEIQAEINIAKHPEWDGLKKKKEIANAKLKDKVLYFKDNEMTYVTTISGDDICYTTTASTIDSSQYLTWNSGGIITWC